MFKKILLAAAFAVATPIAAMAATISSNSQIDIVGIIDVVNSKFTTTGNVTFMGDGTAIQATGDFASITAPAVTTMTDIDFTAPGAIWSVGGFTFTALNFFGIGTSPSAFNAAGQITGNGFDVTDGFLSFTAQNGTATASFSTTTTVVPLPAGVWLMGTVLAGFGVVGRRRKNALKAA